MKTDKIIYWTTTALVSLSFLMGSFMYLTKNPDLMKSFEAIGFPEFFIPLLGTAKLLGGIALFLPRTWKLNEWAYAGLTFILLGAIWTHVATATSFVAPMIPLLLMAISYWFRYRLLAAAGKA